MAASEPAGTYLCSDCRLSWTHDGGPLRHRPVVDHFCTTTPRHWHPCPDCEDDAVATFAHEVRQRTAADLERWAADVAKAG